MNSRVERTWVLDVMTESCLSLTFGGLVAW